LRKILFRSMTGTSAISGEDLNGVISHDSLPFLGFRSQNALQRLPRAPLPTDMSPLLVQLRPSGQA
jgi:hypothetical protein